MIVVVGAGVAGLTVARLLRARGYADVVVLEARRAAGGRVRTVYDGDGDVAYEAGPWRVPSTHARARALMRDAGVRLVPLRTPKLPEEDAKEEENQRGLTTWDANALAARDPRVADALDLATGYADETHSAQGSAPYQTDAPRYLLAPDGLTRAVRFLEGACDDVRYDHRVVDVTRAHDEQQSYSAHVRVRTGHNAFASHVLKCQALFVCVPPHVFREWTALRAHARSVACAVVPGELHHVYVQDARFPRGVHVREPRALAAQIVSSQYPASDWFQASYSGGRLARLWHHLRLSDPARFWRVLRAEVARWTGVRLDPHAPHRSHHWPVAYHAWRAVPHFDLDKAVRYAVEPNPLDLPHLYVAGEAFSSHQAWIEGALETAARAVAAFVRPPPQERARGAASDAALIVNGRVLDVAAWARVHPGGAAPLRAHLHEDVTPLLRHLGHSDHAWAVAHSLKR